MLHNQGNRQSFQLRLPREVHRQASDRAWAERKSLNQWIVDLIERELALESRVSLTPTRFGILSEVESDV